MMTIMMMMMMMMMWQNETYFGIYGLRNFSCGLWWTLELLNQNQAISFGDFTLQPERFREPPGCRRTAHTIAPHGAVELRTLGPPWLPSKGGTDAVWGGSTCVCQPCIVGAYVRGMAIEGSPLRSPAAFRRRGRALQPILLDCPFFTLVLDRTVAIQPGACKGQWSKYNGAIPGRECDSHILGGNLPPRDADSIFPEPGPEMNPASIPYSSLEIW